MFPIMELFVFSQKFAQVLLISFSQRKIIILLVQGEKKTGVERLAVFLK